MLQQVVTHKSTNIIKKQSGIAFVKTKSNRRCIAEQPQIDRVSQGGGKTISQQIKQINRRLE